MTNPRKHTFVSARGETRRTWYGGKSAVVVVQATCKPADAPAKVHGTDVTITLYPCAARWLAVGIAGVMLGLCPHCYRCITNRDIIDWRPLPLVTS